MDGLINGDNMASAADHEYVAIAARRLDDQCRHLGICEATKQRWSRRLNGVIAVTQMARSKVP